MGSELSANTVPATGSGSTDVSDRAGRALGVVASVTAPIDVSDRAGRALGVVASVTAPIDVSDRVGRLLGVIASIAAAVDVSDRAGRLLGVVASITNPVDVSDRAGRALGVIASVTAPIDVSDRVGRLLGVVASITNPVDVSDRAARALGVVASVSTPLDLPPVTLSQTVTGGAAAAATATLPAIVGQRHYITHISIRRVATAALAGGAILAVTTTNLGGRSWRTGNQAGITVSTFDGPVLVDQEYAHPLRSDVVNTATTIVCPAPGAAVSWQIVVDYYGAP